MVGIQPLRVIEMSVQKRTIPGKGPMFRTQELRYDNDIRPIFQKNSNFLRYLYWENEFTGSIFLNHSCTLHGFEGAGRTRVSGAAFSPLFCRRFFLTDFLGSWIFLIFFGFWSIVLFSDCGGRSAKIFRKCGI